MQRRELLKWFLRIAGGYVAVSASPLTRINTTLFGDAKAACVNPMLCGAQDCCTTQDNCGATDTTGHTCSQKDICDVDASNDCTNDECQADQSGKCSSDRCYEDESGECVADHCGSDKSGACVSDRCISDKSGACVSDSCREDKSGACVGDSCVSDKSGACRNDHCISDKSGSCKGDQCTSDSSGSCQSDACTSDKSGACVSDKCATDKSGACVGDQCGEDKSDTCVSDQCNVDASGACVGDSCVSDKSGACRNDHCISDKSGSCKTDSCETDESTLCSNDQCVIDTRICSADTSCPLDGECLDDGLCLDDGVCFGDLCLDDGGCFLDTLSSEKKSSGKKMRNYASNRALKWLYRLSLVIFLVSTLVAPHMAKAAVINVPPGDAASLIAAVNTAIGTPEDDTINLGAGTYTLTAISDLAGLPSITGTMTINGSGTGTTIIQRSAAAEAFGIFHVAPTGNLTLNRLIIQGGVSTLGFGGGIFNEGTLVLLNCTISGNSAQDEELGSAGGAGIGNTGTLTITNSSIFGNTIQTDNESTGVGAGIENIGGGVFLTNTTLYNNAVTAGQAFGSGLTTLGGAVTVTNATISGNSATSTDSFEPFALGGGVFGEAGLRNTIVALNTAAEAPDLFWTLSNGNNLFGNLAGSSVTLAAGDLTGAPGLGSFTDNGTPGNGHLPLLAGSQAINAGNTDECSTNPLLATDQLGRPRTPPCDIGAVEFQAAVVQPTVAVPTLTEWGLIILLVLTGAGAVYRLRRIGAEKGAHHEP